MSIFTSLKNLFVSQKLDVARRFRLEREAISGTMSRFYLAREYATDRLYGLKIVDMKKLAEVESRFKGMNKPTEGEIAVLFHHPYIVRTLEAGETTRGERYLLMEYLGGGGLNTALIDRPEALEPKMLDYMRQMAAALLAVHEAGFIHRDICPRNYIFTEDLKTIKLTDFGLAVPARPPFTNPGNRTGTPNYMAPELARRKPTDTRLDVFSYGVTIYEMLTGKLPWPVGLDGRAALTHDTEPVDIKTVRPKIQPRLAAAIHQCIHPDVNERFPSLQAFLDRITLLKTVDAE